MFEKEFLNLMQQAKLVETRSDGDTVLQKMRAVYGFDHVAYAGLNIPVDGKRSNYYHNSYSDQWRHHYHSNKLVKIDPVMHTAFSSILPQDWRHLSWNAPTGKHVFDQATEFGISRNGVTIPIRGLNSEVAVFSVSTSMNEKEWSELKPYYMRDLQSLAHIFHNSVIRQLGLKSDSAPHLTRREIECLKWAAAGKSAWETSVILNCSESTVRFHIASARGKLDCVTKIQAIVRAASLGYIEQD